MIDTPSNENVKSEIKIQDHLVRDELVSHLKAFASENQIELNEVLKDVSKRKNISLKGLKKIVAAQVSRPSAETQVKVYSYIYKTDSLAELITKLPSDVSNSIQKVYAGKEILSLDDIKTLSKDSVFNSIYILTAGDVGVELFTIKEEFGKKGLAVLDNMLKLKLVSIDENERIKRNKCVFMSKDFRKNLISYIANDLYRADEEIEIGSNFSGCLIGDVTSEDYELIISLMKEFINTKLKSIVVNSKPNTNDIKRIALASIVDEYKLEQEAEGELLC